MKSSTFLINESTALLKMSELHRHYSRIQLLILLNYTQGRGNGCLLNITARNTDNPLSQLLRAMVFCCFFKISHSSRWIEK